MIMNMLDKLRTTNAKKKIIVKKLQKTIRMLRNRYKEIKFEVDIKFE